MDSRDAIIRVAKSYLGACQGSSAHADLIHIFNTVKPYGYTAKKSDAWCAIFATACAIQAYGKKTADKYFPLTAGCPSMIKKAIAKHIWVESDKYIPDKGDFILYDWDDGKNYATTDNKNCPNHVGIVEYYKNGCIHVIEGNSGSNHCVRRTKIHINGKYIRGFVTPDYDRIRVNKNTKTDDEIVREVLSGEWGTGSNRRTALINAGYDYYRIQSTVNRIVRLTEETLDNKYGIGEDRKIALGKDYDTVQWNINRLYKERKKTNELQ